MMDVHPAKPEKQTTTNKKDKHLYRQNQGRKCIIENVVLD
jgi:hypothetical protein